ncbi:roadblock/LC7 domain-containing protein [Streptomyces sp. NPDC087532]|uniref:roadblock/LC7 domain-containing protein n=1 Tax=Streptomyces sp. NPDC087532 TaxID=3365795 RepID=UPI00382DB9FD
MSNTNPPQDLSWLLEDFTRRVPGVMHVLLSSTDGLKLAQASLTTVQAEKVAAALSGLQSLSSALVDILEITASPSGLKQVLVEHEGFMLCLMKVGQGLPVGHGNAGTDPRTVGTCLGVVVEPRADPGQIAYEAGLLSVSLGEYLSTPVRRGGAAASGR